MSAEATLPPEVVVDEIGELDAGFGVGEYVGQQRVFLRAGDKLGLAPSHRLRVALDDPVAEGDERADAHPLREGAVRQRHGRLQRGSGPPVEGEDGDAAAQRRLACDERGDDGGFARARGAQKADAARRTARLEGCALPPVELHVAHPPPSGPRARSRKASGSAPDRTAQPPARASPQRQACAPAIRRGCPTSAFGGRSARGPAQGPTSTRSPTQGYGPKPMHAARLPRVRPELGADGPASG